MITFLFFIFLALVVFHFIYDGILAPSFRLETRLHLFAIRDELRLLKIENDEDFSDELFEDLQDSVNKQISFHHEFSIFSVFQFYQIVRNRSDLDQRYKDFRLQLDNCSIERVPELHKKMAYNLIGSLFINSGGWAVYVLPFILMIATAFLCLSKVIAFASRVLETPRQEWQNFLDDGDLGKKTLYS